MEKIADPGYRMDNSQEILSDRSARASNRDALRQAIASSTETIVKQSSTATTDTVIQTMDDGGSGYVVDAAVDRGSTHRKALHQTSIDGNQLRRSSSARRHTPFLTVSRRRHSVDRKSTPTLGWRISNDIQNIDNCQTLMSRRSSRSSSMTRLSTGMMHCQLI